jgi:trigger factor
LNIQTERLEDQTARVTVEIDSQRLDTAKQKAAQQISRKVNIPGFRKGKVPYRVLVNYVGEPAITEEAVELLGQEVYREMLPQTGLDPYGPGTLTDIKAEEATPTFTYIIPLQPLVDLAGYRSVQLPYTEPETTDESVSRAMKNMQEQEAVVEESQKPAVPGNRITVDLHSYILGDHKEVAEGAEETAEEVEAAAVAAEAAEEHDHGEEAHDHDHDEEEHDHDHEHEDDHGHSHIQGEDGTPYIHEHDMQLMLDEDDDPTPGFNEAMLGTTVGDSRQFVLTFPDDAEKFQDMAGKTVKYYVDTKKVESLTLPELTDEFAARVTKDEEKPLSLLELRMRVRENLKTRLDENYRNEYVRQALDQIVEGANIKFPEAMVAEQVDRFLQDLDQRLRQQGLTLPDYMKITQKTNDDLYADYRENAEQTVRRSLVLREIADLEGLTVTEPQIDEQIEKIVGQFGEDQQDTIRQMFTKQATMRDSVRSDLLRDAVLDRVILIAKGEAPAIEASVEAQVQPSQPQDEVDEATSDNTEESV